MPLRSFGGLGRWRVLGRNLGSASASQKKYMSGYRLGIVGVAMLSGAWCLSVFGCSSRLFEMMGSLESVSGEAMMMVVVVVVSARDQANIPNGAPLGSSICRASQEKRKT